jgi:hypothetical protein
VSAEAVCPATIHFDALNGDIASHKWCPHGGRSDDGGGNSEG